VGHSYFRAESTFVPVPGSRLFPVRRLLPILLFLFPALAQVVVEPGWVRLVPPVVPDTAAYLTLVNRGQTPLRLVGAETPVASRVSLHRDYQEHKGGHAVLGMRPPALRGSSPGGKVAFRPGGYHLMLEGLKRPLKAGEKVELTLLFQGGLKVKVVLPVEMR
jgi:copper(I)-binding protein